MTHDAAQRRDLHRFALSTLFLTMLLAVGLHSIVRVSHGVNLMTLGGLSMVRCFFMMSGLMMFGCFSVMMRGVRKVL
jgi:hypothetical protein